MLHHLRAGATHQIVKVFLVLIIVSFVFWGVGDMLKLRRGETFATIDGKAQITPAEFDKAYRQALRSLMEQEGHMPSPEEIQQHAVRERVLNRLVHQRLINLWHKQLGVEVGDASVINALERSSIYHDAQGKFDKEKFYTLLSVNNLQEAEFISMLRDEIGQQMVLGAVQDGTVVLPGMIETILRYGRSPRRVSYLKLDHAVTPIKAPTEDALKEYYQEHTAEFTTPETRTLTVMLLPLEKLLPSLDAGEQAEILEEAGVKAKDPTAKQVLEDWRLRKAVQQMHQKITQLEDAFAAGDMPEQLAAEFPLTLWQGKATQGDVAGLRQHLPKALAEEASDILMRAYETEEGSASNMVMTEDGMQAYAVWVAQVTPAQPQPYAEVSKKVVAACKKHQQRQVLEEQAQALKFEAVSQKSLAKAAAKAHLSAPHTLTMHFSDMPKPATMPVLLAQTLLELAPGACMIHSEASTQWVGCIDSVTWYEGAMLPVQVDALQQQLLQQNEHVQLEALIQHLYRHYHVKIHPNFTMEEAIH
jgi:hypothetical protein